MSVLKIKNEQGEFISIPSVSGRGITSITKISTVGLIDTYRILYTDGTTQDYQITNGGGGGEGSSNYQELINKPKINDIELEGNKTFEDLGASKISNTEIEKIFDF